MITQDDREAIRRHAINNPDNIITFDPEITATGDLHEQFRIFGKKNKKIHPPATKNPPQTNPTDTVVYTNGACTGNGETTARAGIGIWFGPEDPRNIAAPVGKNIPQSNNTAELLAVYKTLTYLPSNHRIHIKTDSKWVIQTLCENKDKILDSNFAHSHHETILRPTLNKLWRREGLTSFKWVKGHTNIEGNEGADKLASEGAKKDNTTNSIFISSPEFNFNGARLSSLTQATSYKLIRKLKSEKQPPRNRSTANLELARATLSDLTNTSPINERLWRAIALNRRDFSINVRTFLWKLMHDTHKCGIYWTKIPNFEEHGMCNECEAVETMNHILFECQENQNTLIWKITKEICSKKNIPWIDNMDITSIMALPLIQINSDKGKTRHGATRLLQITISECAFLIWKLRCKRILDSDRHPSISALEASNLVTVTLNNRLTQDRILTSKKRYGSKAIPENLVLSTWSGTLQEEHALPGKWLTANGVLVGRTDCQKNLTGNNGVG